MGVIYQGTGSAFVCCYFHIYKLEGRNWDSEHSSGSYFHHGECQITPVGQC